MTLLRPITALLWEISRRRRGPIVAVLGLMLFGFGFKLALPAQFLLSDKGKDLFVNISSLLMVASIVFVLAIFNFTESSPEKEWTGFPYRLFALPLPTLLLVALPLLAGVAVLALVCSFWIYFILTHANVPEPGWLTLLLVSFMVLFQSVLWCLAGFRIGRLLALGLAGPGYVLIGFLPWQQVWPSIWFSQKYLSFLLCGQILFLFGCSWFCVARQRCGGGRRTHWFRAAVDSMFDLLPRRKTDFSSPAGAQFWFEWRRFGMILPLCVAGILVCFIRPLSLHFRSDGDGSLRVLLWTLATPVILGAIIGKGFSKPDFWSNELSYPAFNAVSPIATGEIIVVKMKVAALSTAISWALVLVFLCFWLPGWADLESLNTIRIGFWMAYDHSVLWQNLLAVLIVVAAVFCTWKCLVNGLWSGLSGNWKLYLALPTAYVLFAVLGLVAFSVMLNRDAAMSAWYRADPDRTLSWLEGIVTLAVIVKFFLAAWAWRDISPGRVRKYLFLWACATLCLMGLLVLLWADGLFDLVLIDLCGCLPWDTHRLSGLLILLALLVIPLARIGLAPSSLAKSRHQL